MTLKDIEKLDKEFLLATDICQFLETDPQTLRIQAKRKPASLGFPSVVLGKRVLFPKEAFIKFWRGV